MAFWPQLRSLHMDDRGLNKHNAIMFLNNKTIGIFLGHSDECCRTSEMLRGERVWRRHRWDGKKKRKKFTRPNIIQLAENILNIYGSSFHRYMDLLFTFHSSSLHSLFFSHVCPHDVDFNSTRHTGHKKNLLFGWLCLDMLSMVDKVRFFLFFCDDNLLPEVFIVLCSIFRHCTTYIFLYKIELSTFRHCQKFSSSLFVGCHGRTAAKSRSETKHSIFMVQVRLSSGERGTLGWGKWADIKSRNSCCLSIFGCDVEAKTFIHLSSSIFFFTLFFLRWK